jgi:hypothetical protein
VLTGVLWFLLVKAGTNPLVQIGPFHDEASCRAAVTRAYENKVGIGDWVCVPDRGEPMPPRRGERR